MLYMGFWQMEGLGKGNLLENGVEAADQAADDAATGVILPHLCQLYNYLHVLLII